MRRSLGSYWAEGEAMDQETVCILMEEGEPDDQDSELILGNETWIYA